MLLSRILVPQNWTPRYGKSLKKSINPERHWATAWRIYSSDLAVCAILFVYYFVKVIVIL